VNVRIILVPVVLFAVAIALGLIFSLYNSLEVFSSSAWLNNRISVPVVEVGEDIVEISEDYSLPCPDKYYLHVMTIGMNGTVVGQETLEYEFPAGCVEKKALLVSIDLGNGTLVIVPMIKDLEMVKNAILMIRVLKGVNGSFVINDSMYRIPPYVMIGRVENVRIVLKEDPEVGVWAGLEVEYVNGSKDSHGVFVGGFRIDKIVRIVREKTSKG